MELNVPESGLRSLPLWCGVAAPLVAFAGIVLAVATAPSFSVTQNALSDLGVMPAPTAALFNLGLVATGVVALPFGFVLWSTSHNVFERLGTLSVAAAVFFLALVGVFTLDSPTAHVVVAVSFFVLLTVGLLLYGTGNVLDGSVRRGLATVWLGVTHQTAWLVWSGAVLTLTDTPGVLSAPGLALPELVGAFALSAWTVSTALGPRAAEYEGRE